jgi:hypothetical protein
MSLADQGAAHNLFSGVKKWRTWKSSFNAKLLFRAEQEKKLAQQKKEEEERLRKEEAEKKAKERLDWKLLGRTWKGGGRCPPSWILGGAVSAILNLGGGGGRETSLKAPKKWLLYINAIFDLGHDVISS